MANEETTGGGLNWAALIPAALFGAAGAMSPRSAPFLAETGFNVQRSLMDQLREQNEMARHAERMKMEKARLDVEKGRLDLDAQMRDRQMKIQEAEEEEKQRQRDVRQWIGEFTATGGPGGGPVNLYNPDNSPKDMATLSREIYDWLGPDRAKKVRMDDMLGYLKGILPSIDEAGSFHDLTTMQTYRKVTQNGISSYQAVPLQLNSKFFDSYAKDPAQMRDAIPNLVQRAKELKSSDPALAQRYLNVAKAFQTTLDQERAKELKASVSEARASAISLLKEYEREESEEITRLQASSPYWDTIDGKTYTLKEGLNEAQRAQALMQIRQIQNRYDAARTGPLKTLGGVPIPRGEEPAAPAPPSENVYRWQKEVYGKDKAYVDDNWSRMPDQTRQQMEDAASRWATGEKKEAPKPKAATRPKAQRGTPTPAALPWRESYMPPPPDNRYIQVAPGQFMSPGGILASATTYLPQNLPELQTPYQAGGPLILPPGIPR